MTWYTCDMENVIELYSLDENSRLKKKIKIWTVALGVFVFLAIAACIVLLFLTNTENARRMMIIVIVISSVAGCVAIYVALNVISATARRVAHSDIMLSECREMVYGSFTVSKYKVKIKNSITVKHVFVSNGQNMKRLIIDADLESKLPTDGGDYVFFTVHNYIVALEKYK